MHSVKTNEKYVFIIFCIIRVYPAAWLASVSYTTNTSEWCGFIGKVKHLFYFKEKYSLIIQKIKKDYFEIWWLY